MEWRSRKIDPCGIIDVDGEKVPNNILILIHQDCWLGAGHITQTYADDIHHCFTARPKFNVRSYTLRNWEKITDIYEQSNDKEFFMNVVMIYIISHGTSSGIAHDDVISSVRSTLIHNPNDICHLLHMWCPQVRLMFYGVCHSGAILYTKKNDMERFQKDKNKFKLPGPVITEEQTPVYLIGYRTDIEFLRIAWDISIILDIYCKHSRNPYQEINKTFLKPIQHGYSAEICYQVVSKADMSNKFTI